MDPTERWIGEARDLLRRGDPVAAEKLCRKALARAPGHPGALVLAARLQAARDHHDEAAALLTRAREGAPDDPEVARRLGAALFERFRFDEAAAELERAAGLDPASAQVRRLLGQARWDLWDYAGAAEAFREAARLEPGNRTDIHNLLFCACYDPALSPARVKALHAEWAPRLAPAVTPAPHANDRDPERPLRVGYLSPDFRKHPVSIFLSALVAYHDPRAVETHCYAQVAKPDDVTAAFRRVSPHWRDVTRMDDAEVAGRVREDGIDILVDLAGYTKDTRIHVLARRPAPVQVSYLGYPATTGLPQVDWRLTDAVANPPGTEAFYTERLARMEGGFCCYLPPPDAPDPGPLPALAGGHLTFGSFVNTRKVNPATIALWARVLGALPEARLFLFRHTLASASVRERYLAEFERHGVDRGRVRVGWEMPPLSRGNYFALYREVDAVLDTLPFNGHTSTCESLWMGVPVLTLPGPDFAGRLSAAVLGMAGLGGLVAESPDDLVGQARALAADLGGLARLRAGLRRHLTRSRLLDARASARALETQYRVMWREWCAGEGAGGRAGGAGT